MYEFSANPCGQQSTEYVETFTLWPLEEKLEEHQYY